MRPPSPPGEELGAGTGPVAARFSDGSQVELAEEAKVQLESQTPTEMVVALAKGSATFEVAKRPSRKFVVRAAGVEVKVVGTRFTVHREEQQVEVTVERGIVEVTREGRTVRLTAGMSWSSAHESPVAPGAVGSAAVGGAGNVAAAVEAPTAVEPVVPSAPDVAEAPTPTTPAEHLVHKAHSGHRGGKTIAAPVRSAGGDASKSAAGGVGPGTGADPIPPAAEPKVSEATQIFSSALQARREGRPADAAVAFQRFLRDHSSDARAPLAAFELGRLQMDALSDEKGAAESLARSLQLAPDAQFAEEALSRLAHAYDALGRHDACVSVRDQYLARFPGGAYAASVGGRCKGH